jgi:hypothetical protein
MPIEIVNIEETITKLEKVIANNSKELPDFIEENYEIVPKEHKIDYLRTMLDFARMYEQDNSHIVGLASSTSTLFTFAPEEKDNYFQLVKTLAERNTFVLNNNASKLVEELKTIPEEHRGCYFNSIKSVIETIAPGYEDVVDIMAPYFSDLLVTAPEEKDAYCGLLTHIASNNPSSTKMMASYLNEMLKTYTYDSVKEFVEEGIRIGNKATRDHYKKFKTTTIPILKNK